MVIKLTLKQKTKLKKVTCMNVKFITFEKQYLVVTYDTMVKNEKSQHDYYRLNTVLAVEEH